MKAESNPVASLGLVSPGVATDGVTLFFLEQNDDLLVIALESDDLFSFGLLTTPIFPRRLSRILSKVIHKHNKFYSGVTYPAWMVSHGAVHPLHMQWRHWSNRRAG